MDIIFIMTIQLSIMGTITFCVFAFLQFLLPKFNVLYLLGILYALGSAFSLYAFTKHELIFFTLLAAIALFAVLTVRFYRFIFKLTEQKANEWKEINA